MRTLVTAGPPTSNGDLHLGHLSGPYTAGDVHTRYLRMLGRDVRYISAADDHQSYVALKAAQTGRSPQDVADEYTPVIEESLRKADVCMDYFGRPSRSSRYIEFLQHFVRTLHSKGLLLERAADVPYCSTCDRLLFEAHIKGNCNFCGEGSDGGICEACGLPNRGADLNNARCATCGNHPHDSKPVKRLFFPLNNYKSYVRQYAETAVMNAHARALCDKLFTMDLPEVAVTQPANWGIPVPLDGYESQRISAWFELGPHYLGVTASYQESAGGPDWREVWTRNNEIIQCFGFDSAYFHIVLFPALFHAFDPEITPPRGFIVNEFYRLDGKKFSTSRKHALWASAFLDQYPSDVVRYHLSLTRPESEQTNFTLDHFLATLNNEMIGVWDKWLVSLAARSASGQPGPSAEAWREPQLRFYERMATISRDISLSYDIADFSLQRVARRLGELVREAESFGAAHAFCATSAARGEEHRTNIKLELAAARALALSSFPLMPNFAARLWRDLGYPTPIERVRWEPMPGLPAAHIRPNLSAYGYFSSQRDAGALAA